ncbi:hypothetical protein THAOC_18160, partial [Thalassiosira oceanica]
PPAAVFFQRRRPQVLRLRLERDQDVRAVEPPPLVPLLLERPRLYVDQPAPPDDPPELGQAPQPPSLGAQVVHDRDAYRGVDGRGPEGEVEAVGHGRRGAGGQGPPRRGREPYWGPSPGSSPPAGDAAAVLRRGSLMSVPIT